MITPQVENSSLVYKIRLGLILTLKIPTGSDSSVAAFLPNTEDKLNDLGRNAKPGSVGQEALSRSKIRYNIIGGLGSSGHAWGPTTFLVRSLPGARIQMRSAGFLQSPESQAVLIDSENG